eukprot:5433689-Amphidinium_carterae.1
MPRVHLPFQRREGERAACGEAAQRALDEEEDTSEEEVNKLREEHQEIEGVAKGKRGTKWETDPQARLVAL